MQVASSNPVFFSPASASPLSFNNILFILCDSFDRRSPGFLFQQNCSLCFTKLKYNISFLICHVYIRHLSHLSSRSAYLPPSALSFPVGYALFHPAQETRADNCPASQCPSLSVPPAASRP